MTTELDALNYMLVKMVPDMARGFTLQTHYGDIAIRADEARFFAVIAEIVLRHRIADLAPAARPAIKGAAERMHRAIEASPNQDRGAFEQAMLRLKVALGEFRDFRVAEFLGLSPAALSARKRRGSFPQRYLRAALHQRPELDIDVDYVLTGVRGDVK